MAEQMFLVIEENKTDVEKSRNESLDGGRFKRKVPIRFSCAQDILLLREIVVENPFAAESPKNIWEKIAGHLEQYYPVSGRRCRERCQLLLEHFSNNDQAILKKSGTEEEFQEKQQLLQEVKELRDEGEEIMQRRRSFKLTHRNSNDSAIEIRHAALESLQPRNVIIPSPLSHESTLSEDEGVCTTHECKSTGMVINYLQNKHEQELQLRHEELLLKKEQLASENARLELDREKLKLDREKFEMEKEERKLNSEERKIFLEIIRNLQSK